MNNTKIYLKHFSYLMEVLQCQRHLKKQKLGKIITTATVCNYSECKYRYEVLCSLCKHDHASHQQYLIKLTDLEPMLEQIIITPFTLPVKYLFDSVNTMQKIKFIKDFKRQINMLESEVMKNSATLVESTEHIIHQYAQCKQSVMSILEDYTSLQKMNNQQFQQFKAKLSKKLRNTIYNPKGQVITLGNAQIHEEENKRQKLHQKTDKKIEEVKQYSMKIIEVILAQEGGQQSDDEEQNIMIKKKQYQMLKEQLSFGNFNYNTIEEEYEGSSSISYSSSSNAGKKPNNKVIRRQTLQDRTFIQYNNFQIQTDNKWLQQLQHTARQANRQIDKFKTKISTLENEYQNKISLLQKQKQFLKNDVKKLTTNYETAKFDLKNFYKKILNNYNSRKDLDQERDFLLERILELTHLATINSQNR